MALEIERKFLVVGDIWRTQVERAQRMVQGYLIDAGMVQSQTGTRCSVRVRIAGADAWLNIKSATLGVQRQEYEYAIPVADAERMLADFCKGTVEKVRHYVPHAGQRFEVDEFLGSNQGLIVAELELPSIDHAVERPPWLGDEVTDHLRYFNLHLLEHPFSSWTDDERRGH